MGGPVTNEFSPRPPSVNSNVIDVRQSRDHRINREEEREKEGEGKREGEKEGEDECTPREGRRGCRWLRESATPIICCSQTTAPR